MRETTSLQPTQHRNDDGVSRRSVIEGRAALAVTSAFSSAFADSAVAAVRGSTLQALPTRSRHLVDPETLAALDQVPAPVFSDENLAAIREAGPPQLDFSPNVTVSERIVPGVGGNPDIRVIIVKPFGIQAGAPGLFHIHGGGFVTNTPDMFLGRLTQIAEHCGCVAVSTTYRLAPETRWPGALDDIYTAFRWMHDNASALGVDPALIAITGESSGGGYTAALALRIRDRGGPPILMQLLVYPMLDDHPVPEAHYPGDYVWTRANDRYGWTALLGVPAGSDAVPEGAVPGRVENLSGLPPTYIAVGSLDLFVNANLQFARKLIAAGVPTEIHVVPGAWHGFDVIAAEARYHVSSLRIFSAYLTVPLRAPERIEGSCCAASPPLQSRTLRTA
jgi:acetyl esterase/lipase